MEEIYMFSSFLFQKFSVCHELLRLVSMSYGYRYLHLFYLLSYGTKCKKGMPVKSMHIRSVRTQQIKLALSCTVFLFFIVVLVALWNYKKFDRHYNVKCGICLYQSILW